MIFKVSLFLASLSATASAGKMRCQTTVDETRSNNNRQLMGSMGNGASNGMGGDNTVPLTSVRSFNGAENPLAAPDAELQRFSGPAHYPDGQGLEVSMFTEPNPRSVSNAVASMPAGIARTTVTDAFWQWGQFMDHDIGLTEGTEEVANIITEDPSDSISSIPFRSALSHFTPPLEEDENGIREQLNEITGFLDASMVYGSDDERAALLREFQGGRMRIQENDTLLLF